MDGFPQIRFFPLTLFVDYIVSGVQPQSRKQRLSRMFFYTVEEKQYANKVSLNSVLRWGEKQYSCMGSMPYAIP